VPIFYLGYGHRFAIDSPSTRDIVCASARRERSAIDDTALWFLSSKVPLNSDIADFASIFCESNRWTGRCEKRMIR